MGFEVATHNGAEGADDTVSPFRTQAIPVSKHVTMAENIKTTISSLGNVELDMFASPKIAGDPAVDVPLVRGKNPLLHLHFFGTAPMVANDTRHEHLAEGT